MSFIIDNKRPITVSLLNRISIREISIELGCEEMYHELFYIKSPQLEMF